VLVNNDELTIQSLLKIQSDPIGNYWDMSGDEMNLHMPQDEESCAELLNLAAIPYQIISPGNNAPIIGIFQDSMLGAYRFTRKNIHFTKSEAMDLLMSFNKIKEYDILDKEGQISSFNLLSQIMPPLSLKNKNKFYDDDEDKNTSNNIIEIKNGYYHRGQIDKGIIGSGTKGIIHRITNDFNNIEASDFIDNFQNIITKYIRSSSYSVGISDLITDDVTNTNIISVINEKQKEINDLINNVKLGIFENNTGKSNVEEFEYQINNILNQTSAETSKISLKFLSKENRFVIMVNAGSKGSDLNIAQMTASVGQQNVDGKRIPYGYNNRTLPHYSKFDDSPNARGFVESSYINGLSPTELFFHAMGGRTGLIDTAVKTSTTGYIQRRLIKSMEDLNVKYDNTVRNNKNKIIQFKYGDNGIDTIKVEQQTIPIIKMTIEEIYSYFSVTDTIKKNTNHMFEKNTLTRFNKQLKVTKEKCKFYINFMLSIRENIVKHIFKFTDENRVYSAVSFINIINNIQGQLQLNSNSLVDITPLEAFNMIENAYFNLESFSYYKPTELFKVLYYYYLTPKYLLFVKRFNKDALTILLETIVKQYKLSVVAPGEMVGMIAAQSIGEISTQLTLNTFHFAGVASKSTVTRGVPRMEEILTLSGEPKSSSLNIYLNPEDEDYKNKVFGIIHMLEYTKLEDIVDTAEILFDPDDLNTLVKKDIDMITQYKQFEQTFNECISKSNTGTETEKSKWLLRIELNTGKMLEKNITMDDINFTLKNIYNNDISCVYSDYNSDKLVFRIRMNVVNKKKDKNENSESKIKNLDQSDQIYLLKNFQNNMLQNIILKGVKNIVKAIPRKIKNNIVEQSGQYIKKDIWVLDTVGTNLMSVLSLKYIDVNRTISNNIMEVFNILGVEAARQIIYDELVEILGGTYINSHHLNLLCDRITATKKMRSVFRHGINNDDIGPIAKATFEETPEMFLKAARHSELDIMTGVSANIMFGQKGYYGTSAFQLVLDMDNIKELNDEKINFETLNKSDNIDKMFEGFDIENEKDECNNNNLTIINNTVNIKNVDLGNDDDDYNPGL
jgi:DNA-directed RNA polymerase II subunit RPB1